MKNLVFEVKKACPIHIAFLTLWNHVSYISISIRFLSLFLAFLITIPNLATANTHAKAKAFYFAGQLAKAETAARQALQRRPARATQASIYKIMGMSQYMLGKKTQASSSFKRAKSLNPSIRINPNEALDPSMITFFNSIRVQSSRSSSRSRTSRGPLHPNARANTIGSSKGRTVVFIRSNARGAEIAMDGIIAGTTNTSIDADPGVVSIEVSKRGYRKAVKRISVKPGKSNTFTINLRKIAKPKPKKRVRRSVAVAPVPKAKKRKVRKSRGSSLFAEPPRKARRNSGSSLASEFDAESRGIAPRPAPVPVAPVPVAPAPQTYVAPQPQVVPVVPYYQVPQAYPAPQPYAAPQPYYPPPAAAPPPVAPPPEPNYDRYYLNPKGGSKKRRSSRKSRRSRKATKNSMAIAFLPFGAGQFQNDNPLLGVAFAAGQITGLYLYFDASQQVEEFGAEADRRSEEIQQAIDNASASEQEQLQQEGALELAQYETAISELEQRKTIGIGMFAGLWAASTIEAIVNDNSKRKRRRFSNIHIQDPNQVVASETKFPPQPMQRLEINLGPKVMPIQQEDGQFKAGIGVAAGFKWEF